MRIYSRPDHMLDETKRELFSNGIHYQSETVQDMVVGEDPGFQTIELMGYGYQLTGFDGLLELASERGIPSSWILSEASERTDIHMRVDLNPGRAYRHRKALWDTFLHNGKFSYTYAERFNGDALEFSQFVYIIETLKRYPNSRQAILTMWDRREDLPNLGGRSRVPCSLTYQFLIRHGKLHCVYNQRSCDFFTFFIADVYFAYHLMREMAKHLNLELGYLTHVLGSLHAFKKDMPREVF